MMSLMSANCSESLMLSIADAATSAASLPKLLVLNLICGQHAAAMIIGASIASGPSWLLRPPEPPAPPCLLRVRAVSCSACT
jgi:hypothetical protein